MPLRVRLALLFALATGMAVVVAGVAFVLQLRVSVEASLDPGLRAQAAELTDDPTGADELEPVGKDAIVQVLTADGRVLRWSPAADAAPLLDPGERARAVDGEVSFTTDVRGKRTRVLATAVPHGAGPLLVVVGSGTDVADVAVERAEFAILVGGPAAVLLAGFGAWLLAGAALRPVERMRRQAAEISERDLDRRLDVPASRDEVAALGATMNAVLARLQEALHRERGFVADAGHELRTPLAILRAELELAARPGRSRAALVEAIERAGGEADRLIRLAEDLLLLARADNHQPFLRAEPLSLPDLLNAAVRGAQTAAADRGVTFALHVAPELCVDADPDRLRQAVDNLLDNATRHAPTGGVVEISVVEIGAGEVGAEAGTGRNVSAAPGVVAVEVADRGPGFPPEFLDHAFERFHRAGSARSRDDGGTGLGLSIVRAITRAHGGEAVAENRAGGGAAVTILLPAPRPVPRGRAVCSSSA